MTTQTQTALGFDYGRKRIGIAIGQTLTQTARALNILPARDGKPQWHEVEKLIREWRPDLLIVGLPLHMDGSEHQITIEARRFSRQLEGRYRLPVILQDERLSSWAVEQALKTSPKTETSGKIDHLSAQLIVQDWLQTQTTKEDDE
ncbi:MAG: Holliday junction resolvase RuvX [Gammaproteobacteria bacterium]|nr:Holliday junction resolvase RuvX [Gammaproteobacteria bacterium]